MSLNYSFSCSDPTKPKKDEKKKMTTGVLIAIIVVPVVVVVVVVVVVYLWCSKRQNTPSGSTPEGTELL